MGLLQHTVLSCLMPLWRCRTFYKLTSSAFVCCLFLKTQGTAKSVYRIHGCGERTARFTPDTLWNQFLSQCHTCLPFGVGIRLTRAGACCLNGQLLRRPGDSTDRLPRRHRRKHQALLGPLSPTTKPAAGHVQAVTCHLELIVLFL